MTSPSHAPPPAGEPPLHVVIFPFLSRSHMFPLRDLAATLASHGVKTTVVTTPANSRHFLPFPFASPLLSLHLLPFPLTTQDLSLAPRHLFPTVLSAIDSLSTPLSHLLSSLCPDTLVSDALYHWAPPVARSHKITHIAFNVFGAFPSCAISLLSEMPSGDLAKLPFCIPDFPYQIELRTKSQLPEVLKHPFALEVYLKAERESYAVILNSFHDLEPECTERYKQMGPNRKVLLVGPTCLTGKLHPNVASAMPTRDPILKWLDEKIDKSVVYVSFGTTCQFEGPQLHQLAVGLEECGHPFVWVVRGTEDDNTWMPEGYEQRVSDWGLVVRRWAPQKEILAHRAIGGFMSHCGWNSVMESVCTGVPFATWPLGSEQFLNERLVVEVLKIGVEVRRKNANTIAEETVISKEEVVKAVKELMAKGEEVEAMRRRVKELAELGKRAVNEGGSSFNDLSSLIEDLYKMRHEVSIVEN